MFQTNAAFGSWRRPWCRRCVGLLLTFLLYGCATATTTSPLVVDDVVRVVDPRAGLDGRGYAIIEGRVHAVTRFAVTVQSDTGAVFRVNATDPFEIHRRQGRRGAGIIAKSAIIGSVALTLSQFARVQVTQAQQSCIGLTLCPEPLPGPSAGDYAPYTIVGGLIGAAVGTALSRTWHWYKVAWPERVSDPAPAR